MTHLSANLVKGLSGSEPLEGLERWPLFLSENVSHFDGLSALELLFAHLSLLVHKEVKLTEMTRELGLTDDQRSLFQKALDSNSLSLLFQTPLCQWTTWLECTPCSNACRIRELRQYTAAMEGLSSPPDVADRPDFLRQTTAAFRILLTEASLAASGSVEETLNSLRPSVNEPDSAAELKEESTNLATNYDTFYPGCLLDLEVEEKEAAFLRAERDAASGDRNGDAKSSKKVLELLCC